MAAEWHVAESLTILLAMVNERARKRSKVSDGTKGDPAHKARKSDHNPNAQGVVTALDITHDPIGGCSAAVLAESLRIARDPRIKYVIWNRRMFSSYESRGVPPWTWRPYTGDNPHTKHVHVSVYADDRPWALRVI